MKTAIIDMGTNTFHLLVAEWSATDYRMIYRERIPVRVGVGGINQNIITSEGIDRAVNALIHFRKKIDELAVGNVFAFGTSAIRNARNANEVISKIHSTTGIKTTVISGDQEAQFIYEGVNLALKFGQEKSLVIDIGGGSVEFIIGNGTTIFWKQSFEIGAQRSFERFHKHDPILPREVADVMAHYANALRPLFDAMQIHRPKVLAGSSGTFDTLSEIYCRRAGIELKDEPETPLTIDGFLQIYPDIISKSRAERLKIEGMLEMRVDMIVVACCLITFLIEKFPFDKIRVSSFSLKEGALAALMQGKLKLVV